MDGVRELMDILGLFDIRETWKDRENHGDSRQNCRGLKESYLQPYPMIQTSTLNLISILN